MRERGVALVVFYFICRHSEKLTMTIKAAPRSTASPVPKNPYERPHQSQSRLRIFFFDYRSLV